MAKRKSVANSNIVTFENNHGLNITANLEKTIYLSDIIDINHVGGDPYDFAYLNTCVLVAVNLDEDKFGFYLDKRFIDYIDLKDLRNIVYDKNAKPLIIIPSERYSSLSGKICINTLNDGFSNLVYKRDDVISNHNQSSYLTERKGYIILDRNIDLSDVNFKMSPFINLRVNGITSIFGNVVVSSTFTSNEKLKYNDKFDIVELNNVEIGLDATLRIDIREMIDDIEEDRMTKVVSINDRFDSIRLSQDSYTILKVHEIANEVQYSLTGPIFMNGYIVADTGITTEHLLTRTCNKNMMLVKNANVYDVKHYRNETTILTDKILLKAFPIATDTADTDYVVDVTIYVQVIHGQCVQTTYLSYGEKEIEPDDKWGYRIYERTGPIELLTYINFLGDLINSLKEKEVSSKLLSKLRYDIDTLSSYYRNIKTRVEQLMSMK